VDLIVTDASGLYCPPGDFHIDPWRPVDRAIITHAHSDHARPGSASYLCHEDCAPILRKRLGDVVVETLSYGATIERNGVTVSLHPAGHILGSAQIRLEYRGVVWVASGDYKIEQDGTCAPFDPLRCDVFITESTFGLPIFRWAQQAGIFEEINRWWRANAESGRPSLIEGYSLGKAQRLLFGLDPATGPIICHGAVEAINAIYRARGVPLPSVFSTNDRLSRKDLLRALAIAPPGASRSLWARRFPNFSDAFASGWMQIRGNRRRRGVDQGFVLSDHADWQGLLDAIAATGAARVLVTHGAVSPLVRYLQEKGLDAAPITADYGDTSLEEEAAAETPDEPSAEAPAP
jgi:putative mRNA 3-end processing factor